MMSLKLGKPHDVYARKILSGNLLTMTKQLLRSASHLLYVVVMDICKYPFEGS